MRGGPAPPTFKLLYSRDWLAAVMSPKGGEGRARNEMAALYSSARSLEVVIYDAQIGSRTYEAMN